jgi:peptidoglycan/LPS O-acetylase OafA/YrhL
MRHLAIKIFRFLPLNMIALCVIVWMLPFVLGIGPLWNTFDQMMKPCQDKWWTNLLWISNVYPAEYDDRCLPWTWFVPCYVQMSILLPFLLMIYVKSENTKFTVILYASIFVASIAATFGLVYSANVGGSIAVRKFE